MERGSPGGVAVGCVLLCRTRGCLMPVGSVVRREEESVGAAAGGGAGKVGLATGDARTGEAVVGLSELVMKLKAALLGESGFEEMWV